MAAILTRFRKTPWPKIKMKQIIGSMKFKEGYDNFYQS